MPTKESKNAVDVIAGRAFADGGPRAGAAKSAKYRKRNLVLATRVSDSKTSSDFKYLPLDQKQRLRAIARKKRVKEIYQLHLQHVPMDLIAERKGLTVSGVQRIIAERARWIDIKTAAEVEGLLLVQLSRLALLADDLIAGLNNEEDAIEKAFLSSKNGEGKYYEVEVTDYRGIPMTRKISYHRAIAMLRKEKIKATLDVLQGAKIFLPQNVFNVYPPSSQLTDSDLSARIEQLQNRKQQLIGGHHEEREEVEKF